MSEQTHFEIPLFDIGPEGAGFRVDNEPGGNGLQRQHGDQYKSSDVMYQANLFAVVHGTMTPDGKRGVLIVMDFHFVSNPQGRRFKSVDISVAFGRKDEPIGGVKEPVVMQIAPHGTYGMDESTQTQEDTFEAHGSAQGGASLATLGIGGSFQRKLLTDKKNYAMLHGLPWIEVRNAGEWNSAKWHIKENRILKNGVPAQLRTAILLSLPEESTFRAELAMEADIGGIFKLKRTVSAWTGLQPIYFDPSKAKRVDLGPALNDVNKTNLIACNLTSMGSAKVR